MAGTKDRAHGSIRIKPVKQYRHDTELGCFTLRVVAYRVECDCGYKSAYFPDRKDARSDQGLHRESCR